MGLKVTAVLAVLLLGLVGFVFLYERPRMAEEQREIEAKNAFIEVQRHRVARLTLTNDYGHFVAEKRGNEWGLIEPLKVPADWLEFEGMIEIAQIVERGRVVVDEGDYAGVALADFGLDPPVVEVRFEPVSGDPVWLFFGDDIPSRLGCYLTWSGGNKVVLTKKQYRARFNRPLMALRDTRAFSFDSDLVTRAYFQTPGGEYEVVRDGLKWHLVQPIKERADAREVLTLLGQLKDERVASFHKEAVDDPTIYGFDDPDYKVVLHLKDNEVPNTLLLGKRVPNNRQKLWYGRVMDRPQVFIVEQLLAESLDIPLTRLRYKRVFEFDRRGIDRVRLAYRDSVVNCAKDGDNSWQVAMGDGRVVEGGAGVEDLIDRVHNLVVAEFPDQVDKSAADSLNDPVLTISLWRGETLVQELIVGQANNFWYGKAKTRREVVVLPYSVMSWLQLNWNSGVMQEGA